MSKSELERIKGEIWEDIKLKERISEEAFLSKVISAADLIASSVKKHKKVFLCGNGGSAADCQHWAAEMTGRFLKERESLAFISLTVNTSAITSISNDYSFERVFARQLEGLGCPGDILVCISTSGKSRNIILAAEAAKTLGIKVIALTGISPSFLSGLADVEIPVPSRKTPRIQESHIFIVHTICRIVEETLFPGK